MNEKKMRKINRRVDEILVGWLKTLVSPEEAKGINMDNISSLMPDQNYYDKDLWGIQNTKEIKYGTDTIRCAWARYL